MYLDAALLLFPSCYNTDVIFQLFLKKKKKICLSNVVSVSKSSLGVISAQPLLLFRAYAASSPVSLKSVTHRRFQTVSVAN